MRTAASMRARLASPWSIAAASAVLATAVAWNLRPAASQPDGAHAVVRAARTPERATEAFAEALAVGHRSLALALSSGAVREELRAGRSLQPPPHAEVFVEELRRLPDGRAEVIAATEMLDADAGFTERALRVVLRQHDARWYVDEISWADGD